MIKAIGITFAWVAAAVVVVGCLYWVDRAASNVVTTVSVVEVEPGIRCAKMVTSDGAAIDCWETTND